MLLLPDAAEGSLRVGVSVPAGTAGAGDTASTGGQPDARTVLQQVLAVTGGHGGGSGAFAQGGGAELGDLATVTARIRAALGLGGEPDRAG